MTEEWANATLVGPRAREVLGALAPRLALDRASFPFMQMREADVAGIPARVFRVSFSGELSYEINVPSDHGLDLWERLISAGMPHGITPYGTEAMHVLRAEKGYIMVGQETDGSVTPLDLGLGGLVAREKDFLGRRSLARGDTARADRRQLVGVLPDNPEEVLPEGAQLVAESGATRPAAMIGHVTSSYFGARLGRSFALALVAGGRGRHGEPVWAPLPDRTVAAHLCPPVFYDIDNRRRDGAKVGGVSRSPPFSAHSWFRPRRPMKYQAPAHSGELGAPACLAVARPSSSGVNSTTANPTSP